jgi:hypothetical protein
MNIFSAIANGLKKIWSVISSPKAQKAIAQAAALVEIALPIVQELSAINPKSAKIQQVFDAYEKYGVPMIANYTQDPKSIGNALLNLASEILRKKLPASQADAATNILNTAVQLAVTAIKA